MKRYIASSYKKYQKLSTITVNTEEIANAMKENYIKKAQKQWMGEMLNQRSIPITSESGDD